MASRSRSCKNHPDLFCYICGKFKVTDEIMPILSYNLVIKTNHGLYL